MRLSKSKQLFRGRSAQDLKLWLFGVQNNFRQDERVQQCLAQSPTFSAPHAGPGQTGHALCNGACTWRVGDFAFDLHGVIPNPIVALLQEFTC
jgi:hypothetical protein